MKGLGVSGGIAIEKAYIFIRRDVVVNTRFSDVQTESLLFDRALKEVMDETSLLRLSAASDIGKEGADVMDAHLTILSDPELSKSIKERIAANESASSAIDNAMNDIISLFEEMDDEYFKERALDYKDIKERLLRAVLGVETPTLAHIDYPCILVAEDLTPSETVTMDSHKIKGIITSRGGPNSHTAILSRMLGIPAIVGIENIQKSVGMRDVIALNGDSGEALINPTDEILVLWRQRQVDAIERRKELKAYIPKKCLTADGVEIELFANIGAPDDIKQVNECGADGVGLFRSEFLFLNRRSLPSEDEQFNEYQRAIKGMNGKPVIIRTLDVGGDKDLPYLNLDIDDKEENPYLGLRAIRLCMLRTDIFKTQIRAMLRASAYGRLLVMIPMICNIEELRDTKRIIEEVKKDLQSDDVPFDHMLKVGIMVETPAVAIQANVFAKESDFFSIGTNDLTQYTLAVDRGNKSVSHLYNHCHPAVVNLIANTIHSAETNGIPCGMCGEAAGETRFIPVLIGLGLKEFSMNTGSVLAAKKLISSLDKKHCEQLAQKVLAAASVEEVDNMLDVFINQRSSA